MLRRVWSWIDDRLGFSATVKPVAEHPTPRTGWDYALGSAALVAFTVQVITGVALAFSYVPAPNSAYESLEFITHSALLGNLVRGIHYWGASAMVLLVAAHMAQVFLVGSFKFPRELNWLTGCVLLLLTLGLAFTGQLLRWNQDAYWAVVVGAAQAARAPVVGDWLASILIAGQTVGGATLTRFYATHVFLLPAGVFLVIGIHLYLVLRHGVSEPPVPGRPVEPTTYRERYEELVHREGVPFWPDAAWKDVVFALAVGAVVVLLAIAPGPPELGPRADPTVLPAYPRPDWYFLWYFALLALVPAGVEDWFIIGFPLLIGAAILSLPFVAPRGERHPWRRPWAPAIVVFVAVGIAVLVWEGARARWSPVFGDVAVPEAITRELGGSAARGATLFSGKACISCHQIAGAGGARGPELTLVGERLTREQLTWRILYGGENMPAYGALLDPADLTALVDFLETRRSR
ncbi:MAG TPA: cytochrome b N-terminal domain-containing protein [Chloroflexota bacterium]|jgi:ubiquinol-cytochrome c reductase cytochrome b subunit|nr:cytochrome b N-terminal domain-containing protein [Chloroflexota bacterium]